MSENNKLSSEESQDPKSSADSLPDTECERLFPSVNQSSIPDSVDQEAKSIQTKLRQLSDRVGNNYKWFRHNETWVEQFKKTPCGCLTVAIILPLFVALIAGIVVLYIQSWIPANPTPITSIPTDIAISTSAPTVTLVPSVTSTPTITPTPLPFPPAQADEILTVITTFHHTADATDTLIQNRLFTSINDSVVQLNLRDVRAGVDPTVLQSPNQQQAEAIGRIYNASAVIWGDVSQYLVTVNFLNLREATIPKNIGDNYRSESVDPYYFRYVTEELPTHVAFINLHAIGQAYYGQAQYFPALMVMESAALRIEPYLAPEQKPPEGVADAYFLLGRLYEVHERLEEAEAAYTRAIELEELAKAYNNRGNVRSSLGEIEQALQDYNDAIRIDPELAETYNNLGVIWAGLNDPARANDYFNQAISINPYLAVAYNNRALTFAQMNLFSSAAEDLWFLERTFGINPNDRDLFNYLLSIWEMGLPYEPEPFEPHPLPLPSP